MIDFEGVTVTYAGAAVPTLRDVELRIPEGEFALVVGPTGVGKSTLLGAVNGLVPHFSGGTLRGSVRVDGRDTKTWRPRDLADVVGVVGQDPSSGFVTDTVEEELAYSMEQLSVAPDVMRKRVEETMDLLGVADLRARPLWELSGGQQQRVAIGAALTAHPRVLVLDEPTSALDPNAAEEVLASVLRLVHDLGVTVVIAEHRLERVVQYSDVMIEVSEDGRVRHGPPASILENSVVAPPVVELGRVAKWRPLPLSVRDARREAGPLRERLAPGPPAENRRASASSAETLLRASEVVVRYGDTFAVRKADFAIKSGEVVALMGRNGSGKSSLLWAIQGSGTRQAGSVRVDGKDPGTLAPHEARRLVALVPQSPADLLYLETVEDECAQADRESDVRGAPSARKILERLAPGVPERAHPRDLSEGQRLALVLAIQLAAAPRVVLLDEPTRGLDYAGKRALIETIGGLTDEGRAVAISTHDVEFAALAADRVVVMAAGEVVVDGAVSDVLVASPSFAPQVSKILAPLRYLTVDQVETALEDRR